MTDPERGSIQQKGDASPRDGEFIRCPHCGSIHTHGHGTFPRKDGTREPRRRCLTCGRTFSPPTGTPEHYIKKRNQWRRLPRVMSAGLSIRAAAAFLRISTATAFAWRHRRLAAMHQEPQPRLDGTVDVTETFVPYSEKGSRNAKGPGAWGRRRNPEVSAGRERFRRFSQAKPSCVILAKAGEHISALVAGLGRPSAGQLQSCLGAALDPEAELVASGLAPYAEACRQLSIRHLSPAAGGCAPRGALWLRSSLHAWLRPFRGVATRYLHHYLTWFRGVAMRLGARPPGAAPGPMA